MSGSLWVKGPGLEFVAEDHVWALKAFVNQIAGDITGIATRVRFHASQLGEDPWANTPVEALKSVGFDIEALALDATWLSGALDAYAKTMASQEAARARVLGAPTESVIAMGLVMALAPDQRVNLREADIPLVAGLFLGDDFTPDDVQVWQVSPGNNSPVGQATSVEERIQRIPAHGPPIRIERYNQGDGTYVTEVFIAGTKDWGVGQTAQPFDLESNVALVAGVTASSLVAVEMAMRRSGVRPGDRVTFVGHSQGGLVAARLAESGKYKTTGLVSAGAPLGSSPITGDYPALVISHTDDVVPILAGQTEHQAGWQFERHSGGRLGDVFTAHSLEAYAETARAIDESRAATQWGDWSGSDHTTTPAVFDAKRSSVS